MKFLKSTLTFLAVLAVFGVSFAMGHISAVKSSELRNREIKQEAERAVAILPLLRASEAPDGEDKPPASPVKEPEAVHTAAPGEAVEEEAEQPPCPVPYPVSGSVSSPYSLQAVYSETMQDWRTHQGMDIDAPLSSAVTAVADGKVIRAAEDKLWGNVIELQHKGGLKTVYKGVSTLSMVKVGEEVSAGEVISGVGTSPAESKAMPHLHFETWQDGVCVNPECYVVGN